jgi:hypothetical protein
MRLVLNNRRPSDSTVGARATQMKLPVSSDDGVEREIRLWDFGGQADQSAAASLKHSRRNVVSTVSWRPAPRPTSAASN